MHYRNYGLYQFQSDLAYNDAMFYLEKCDIKNYCLSMIRYRVARAKLIHSK